MLTYEKLNRLNGKIRALRNLSADMADFPDEILRGDWIQVDRLMAEISDLRRSLGLETSIK